jgi:hypothetical protein
MAQTRNPPPPPWHEAVLLKIVHFTVARVRDMALARNTYLSIRERTSIHHQDTDLEYERRLSMLLGGTPRPYADARRYAMWMQNIAAQYPGDDLTQ